MVPLSATGWNEGQTKSEALLMRSELPKTLNNVPMDPRTILRKWHANKRVLILQPDIWLLYQEPTQILRSSNICLFFKN